MAPDQCDIALTWLCTSWSDFFLAVIALISVMDLSATDLIQADSVGVTTLISGPYTFYVTPLYLQL